MIPPAQRAHDIDYLIKENRKLKIQNQEIRKANRLHKEAVIKLSQPHVSAKEVISILIDVISHSGKQEAIEQYRAIIEELEAKVVVLEKILTQALDSEKQTYALLCQEFQKIQKESARKDEKLEKFYEKIGEVDYLSGLVIKQVQITTPSEQALAFQKEQEQLLEMLAMQKSHIKKLIVENDKLIKINVHMKDEVERKKDDIRNMTMIMQYVDDKPEGAVGANTGGNMILADLDLSKMDESVNIGRRRVDDSVMNNPADVSRMNTTRVMNQTRLGGGTGGRDLNTTLNFIEFQRNLLKPDDPDNGLLDDSDEEYDCPQLSVLFPDKVHQIKLNHHERKIPHLNMMKVREAIKRRQERIRNPIQADRANLNPTAKIIELQTALDITRKQLANLILKSKSQESDHRQVLVLIDQLENRNQVLVANYQSMQEKYRKLYKSYEITHGCATLLDDLEDQAGGELDTNNNPHLLVRTVLDRLNRADSAKSF